jgi:hypothetical protein
VIYKPKERGGHGPRWAAAPEGVKETSKVILNKMSQNITPSYYFPKSFYITSSIF